MASLFLTACLAFTSSVTAAPSLHFPRQTDDSTTSNATLAPVTVVSDDVTTFKPSSNVSLPYGSQQTDQSSVNVNLTTSSPSVLLESFSTVVSVDCASDSVSVVFDNADDLASAYNEWSSHSVLVFVTNHMGDCDTEFERGFFTADSYTTDESTLTLVASTQKSSINDVASEMTTIFSGMSISPSTASKVKRTIGDVTYSPDPINFSTELVLNETVLFSDDSFTATLDSGDLSLSVTVGGSLTYNVLKSELVELILYLETNTTSDLVIDFGIDFPSNETFSYTKALDYYVVDVPGVISFGPQISFVIGAELVADAAVDVVLDLSSTIYNGSFTLDYTGNLSASGSWSPTFDVSVEISEAAGVSVNPFVTSLFELDLSILGGVFNVSGGIAPNVSFPTTVALDADQEIGGGKNETVTITDKGSDACENGVELVSDFDFSLDAFVVGQWNDEYAYNVSLPILDQCLSWA
ncbi:hypothetical protein N0V93_005888 [Gnomoniopsis smithogilvyi]|uniref:DUF7029 domain-containing protein n=1 Tax=Gnomoniopsis smithogilvyi TaxID=1191159 RepID=A0A9W8YV92_9PEZI|nr:hypothetical protein N0V93_005888 [Gnomoniopsis smithogilvyi]